MRSIYWLLLVLLVGCADAEVRTNLSLEDLGNGIYIHHGEHLDIDEGYQGDICNISFVVGDKGVAVIDTGGSYKVGNQLRNAIKSVTDKPILYVINTHVHPDHIYGNAAFIQDNVAFIGHEKLAETMYAREEAYTKLNQQYLGEDAKDTVLVKPTTQISGDTSFDLGGRQLTVRPFSVAHTNTDVTVVDEKTKTLFTGDLLFIERTPVLEGDIKGLIAAIDTLKTYDVNQVVPGHGPATKDWQQALDNEQRYLKTMLADIRKVIDDGGEMEDAMDTAAASEKDNWLLFDIANRRNVNTIYPALEWE